ELYHQFFIAAVWMCEFLSVLFYTFQGHLTFNNFILINTPKTWLQAQEYCRTNHDDLASVSDDGERQHLVDLMKGQSINQAWIGLFRVPWTSWSDNTYTGFYNWDAEPTFYTTDDHCAYLSSSTGKWYEILCSDIFPFFCYRGEIMLCLS
uniref:C-type lectin domain-containing protein n=1 Tax=Periophthalmus magnuspinnatus TaxID=409849 RepID=A0A3B4BH62_9GOBI